MKKNDKELLDEFSDFSDSDFAAMELATHLLKGLKIIYKNEDAVGKETIEQIQHLINQLMDPVNIDERAEIATALSYSYSLLLSNEQMRLMDLQSYPDHRLSLMNKIKHKKENRIENNITIIESMCSNVDALESMYSQNNDLSK